MSEHEKPRQPQPEGWYWRDLGPQGPGWYPPMKTGTVDRREDHLVLESVDESRTPSGPALAWAGFDADDLLVVELESDDPEALAAVERLTGASFELAGDAPRFELAWSHAASTANREYANPRWRAVHAGS